MFLGSFLNFSARSPIIGVNIIEATIRDFPTLKTFTIGGRLSF